MTAPAERDPRLHRFAVLVAGATFLLVIAGGLVTSTGSGLAVPDWPLSFGQVFPKLEGGVLFEHGHRMVAAAVGLLTAVLAAWAWRREPRRWVRRLGLAALGAVVLQGMLGGTTVLLRLPSSVSVAHAGLAQVFFCLTVALAVVTSAWWADAKPASAPEPGAPTTRTLTLAAATVVYAQILLGAVVRHTGAGLVIPDFPLAYGRLWPEIASPLVAYQMAHRLGAVVVAAFALWSGVRVLGRHADEPALRRPALALLALVAFQIFLGALTIWTRRAVIPTTAHVASGALLLATTVVLTLRAHRALG
ncbi:MAG: hypothetical protein A2083_02635 [Gemmatimonadetes bacterium GWC2_71_9]|nr:MAG: hypothetical protein A2083_02635 [Gemmatimonadetes bacterium GWC2_71_9]OGT96806.1 MAG: hypothetical protein A3I79_03050 [Gemmatimonadetes bacterium RIFCSPLOWO2_02_FULL_71_11]